MRKWITGRKYVTIKADKIVQGICEITENHIHYQ